jgi:hypothetical protein
LAKVIAICLATALFVGGCASRIPGYPAPAVSSAAAPSPVAAGATRAGELNALTARGVVDALAGEGFAVPNPLDTTAQECPAAGCDQSIVTDTLRVKSFPTTAAAQTYAEDSGLQQVQTIVVRFAPPVPKADRDRYWAQIQALVR